MIDEDEYMFNVNGHPINGALIDYGDIEEEIHGKESNYGNEDEYKHSPRHEAQHSNGNIDNSPTKATRNDDEVVQKIVNKIYEKMSHQANSLSDNGHLLGDNNLMSRLLSSISEREIATPPSNRNSQMNSPKRTSPPRANETGK